MSYSVSLLKDIYFGPDDSFPLDFTLLNNKLIFRATDSANGRELWITDGTAAGTTLLKDINPGGDSFPFYFTRFNNRVFFRANDGTNGIELWVTDGTAAGTTLLRDINPGAGFSL